MSESEPKPRKQRGIVNDKIDRATTAYQIIVTHLRGPTRAAKLADRPVPTVYGWLQRGRVPSDQQLNLSERAEAAGKPFPAEWYLRVPEDAATATAEAA